MADGLPIGVRIARRRQALGMKQEDLAREVGVSRAAVSNWEAGKHFPTRKLGAVEAVLGISLDDEPQPDDPVPPEVREVIRRMVPADRVAHVERVVEEALRDGQPPKRRQEPPAKTG